MYKQPIILFGIVIPVILASAIIGGGMVVRGQVVDSYEKKARGFKNFQKNKMMVFETESQIAKQREVFQKWNAILEQESFALLGTTLRTMEEKLPPKEFETTGTERLNNKSGFGMATAEKSSGMKFNLRGTYRTVQKALLELETRMPNLQLQDMRIEPIITDELSLLNFQLNYTAWEK